MIVSNFYIFPTLKFIKRSINIYVYLGEVGWGDVDWIGLAKDRNRRRALVNSVSNL
jgi:hypothetical protein